MALRGRMLLIWGLALSGYLQGQPLQVCVEDRVGLDSAARASFHQAFAALLDPSVVRLHSGPCETSVRHSARLSIRFAPTENYKMVLGLARRNSQRILPQMEVYLTPVLRVLGDVRTSAVVGRALARVSPHEVAHYLFQQAEHEPDGLLKERFTGRHLADGNSDPFYLVRAKGIP